MSIKYAGAALSVGVVLSILSGLLSPGNVLINPVDQTDFHEALRVIGEMPNLAHVMVFLGVIAMVLISFGAFCLFPLASRQGGLSGTLLQFGIILSIIEWSILIVGLSMRHFVAHLMQRASNAVAGSEDQIFFQESALIIHADLTAVFLGFVTIFPFASMLMGIGLASRIQSMNAFKIAAYLLILCGALGLITYFATMLAPGDEPAVYLAVFNLVLSIGSIGLFIIGIGMYRGVEGLTEESS